jgi:hypothetical protein
MRWRWRIPLPHVLLHGDQSAHEESKQSRGQWCWLHTRSSLKGHALPSCSAATCTVTARVSTPEPQETVQGCQASSVKTQSTGHPRGLHESSSRSAGHGVPPCCGVTEIRRDRLRTPPPQGSVHCDQLPHVATSQLTGHALVAHTCACCSEGQRLPPAAATCATVRERAMDPVSHVALQEVQLPQGSTMQSTGQAPSLQTSSSTVGHGSPPAELGLLTYKPR